jgi:hypothetical protein
LIALRYPITVSGFLRQHPQTQSLLVHPLAAVTSDKGGIQFKAIVGSDGLARTTPPTPFISAEMKTFTFPPIEGKRIS